MIITDLTAAPKYSIIYADPPWTFRTWSSKGKGKSAESHYRCMSKADIQRVPVSQITADDCTLFLWVTFPCLQEGLELIKAWGFKYKTCAFTWVKKCRKTDGIFTGLGYWTRANAEICLLATKGNPKRISKSVKQVIISRVRDHSRKPDEARERIVQLMGNIPRIELFARQTADGWDSWGDEVEAIK